MNGLALKIIACVAMAIDHLAIALLNAGILAATDNCYEFMRIIGRMAFPLFCFLMAEGARYTRNSSHYLLRVFSAAVISEIPFDWCVYGTHFSLEHQNVLWTLLLGLFVVLVMKKAGEQTEKKKVLWDSLSVLSAICACLLGNFLHTDYGEWGVFCVILLGHLALPLGKIRPFAEDTVLRICFFTAALIPLILTNRIELYALIGAFFLFLYNGEKGYHKRTIQWLFYGFYPLHLMIIALAVHIVTV